MVSSNRNFSVKLSSCILKKEEYKKEQIWLVTANYWVFVTPLFVFGKVTWLYRVWSQVTEDGLWDTSMEEKMGLDAQNVWLVHEKALDIVRDILLVRIDDYGFAPCSPHIL